MKRSPSKSNLYRSGSLQIAGYNKQTERLAICHPLSKALAGTARSLADLDADDDGLGIHPLAAQAAAFLGVPMQERLDPDLYHWFLEPGDRG